MLARGELSLVPVQRVSVRFKTPTQAIALGPGIVIAIAAIPRKGREES
jgi:hypothetical protein